MIENQWQNLPSRFAHIGLDEYVVMPNHFHGIIKIVGATLAVAQNANDQNENRAGTRPAPTKIMTVGDIVGAFKSITTNEYIRNVKQNNWKPFAGTLWQRNYYEHVIRNEVSLQRIREYIAGNPQQWQQDELFVD